MKTPNIAKFALALLAVATLCLSCNKDDGDSTIKDKPGEIVGMGETEGTPTGTLYSLAGGITLESELVGTRISTMQASSSKSSLEPDVFPGRSMVQAALKTPHYGSGYWVIVNLTLKNSNTSATDVVFPAGLMVLAKDSYYQHGILLKSTKVNIPASSSLQFNLCFYCTNKEKHESNSYARYDFGVISNSSTVVDLINRLKNKEINIEKFDITDQSKYLSYQSIAKSKLQDILWDLTDRGKELSQENIEYINNLPNSN